MEWSFKKFIEKTPWGKRKETALPSSPGQKILEEVLPKFLKKAKKADISRLAERLIDRMQKDQVDVGDEKAVRAWVDQHQSELEKFEPLPKVETFVRPGPRPGRNDPCRCGSGTKNKKCCGPKEAKV